MESSTLATASMKARNVVPIIISWETHNLRHQAKEKDLDTELDAFKKFLKCYMFLEPEHVKIPQCPNSSTTKVCPCADIFIVSALKMIFKNHRGTLHQPEWPLILLFYAGHGTNRATIVTKEIIFVLDSGCGQLASWSVIAATLESSDFDCVILLDACHSGSAILNFKEVNPKARGKIALLSASAWATTTPVYGPDTFTKRVAKAISQAVNVNQPITTTKLYRDVLRQGIMARLGTPMLSFAGKFSGDLVIHPQYRTQFLKLHNWTLRYWIGNQIQWLASRPDLGYAIAIKRAGFDVDNLQRDTQGYMTWVPWFRKMKVKDLIDDWQRVYQLKEKRTLKLRYINKVLDNEADLITTMQAIRRSQNDDWSTVKQGHLFVLSAIIEDDSNPFGCNLEDPLPASGYYSFGMYMNMQNVTIGLLRESPRDNEDYRYALQPFIEGHEVEHLRAWVNKPNPRVFSWSYGGRGS